MFFWGEELTGLFKVILPEDKGNYPHVRGLTHRDIQLDPIDTGENSIVHLPDETINHYFPKGKPNLEDQDSRIMYTKALLLVELDEYFQGIIKQK
jgi:hypothetical protein